MRILLVTVGLLSALPSAAQPVYPGAIALAPLLPALPRWGYLALAGALIAIGIAVMRRREG